MKYENLLKIIKETATAGSTCSANIAVSINSDSKNILRRNGSGTKGTIGVGFDADGDWGIYPKPKKNKKEK